MLKTKSRRRWTQVERERVASVHKAHLAQEKSNKEWVTFTPPEPEIRPGGFVTYDLEMYVDNKTDDVGQDIKLTREEFEKLKQHLTRMRTWRDYKAYEGLDPIKCIHYRCNRFSLGVDGPGDDPAYLMDTDGDGDWIYSGVDVAMLPGMNPVLVLVDSTTTTKEDAARMLRKVADSIEAHGIRGGCHPTRTEHPFLAKYPDLAANLRKHW